jgi:dienelactone hydrolase
MNERIDTSRRRFLRTAATVLVGGLAAGPTRAEKDTEPMIVDDWLKKQVEDAPLALRFRGSTAEDCKKWQAAFAAKLRSLLGPHAPPEKWETTTVRGTDLDDHRREELVLTADGHPPLPLYLLTPLKKADKPRAGILTIHGHGRYGNDPVAGRDDLPGIAASIWSANYDYGRQLARRGYIVAVPCLTPFGRRLGDPASYGKQDPCAITFLRMQMLGKLLIAENLRDCLWSLELLARHPLVDAKRLGCAGLSYGGRMTMLTTALEPRVRCAVVSGALNVMQERISTLYSCGAQVIPRLLEFGDVPEIGSLIAPRPCVWEVGSRDSLIDARRADDALSRMRRAYKALGAEDQLQVDRFDGGHQWSGRLGYRLFEEVLQAD